MNTLAEAVQAKYGKPVRLRTPVTTQDTHRPLLHKCSCGRVPSISAKILALLTFSPADSVLAKFDRGLRAFIGRCRCCDHMRVTPLE